MREKERKLRMDVRGGSLGSYKVNFQRKKLSLGPLVEHDLHKEKKSKEGEAPTGPDCEDWAEQKGKSN